MPIYEIKGPDGRVYEIDAPDEQRATAAWAAATGAAGAGAGASTAAPASVTPKQDSLTWANIFNAGLRGIPVVGGLTDNYNAAVKALGGAGEGATFGERYTSNLTAEKQREQKFDTEHPYISTGAQLAGGIAATAPFAAVGPLARATGITGPLPQQIVRGAATGATAGGADAALRGEAGDALLQGDVRPGALARDAGKGALLGTAAGAAAPLVGAGLGAGAEAVTNQFRGGMAVPGTNRAATTSVLRTAGEDGMLDPAAYAAQTQKLGPEGMLLDMGRAAQEQASAAASLPGRGQVTVDKRLAERAAGAPQRVEDAAATSLGNAGTVTFEKQLLDDEARLAGAQFDVAKQYTGQISIAPVVKWLDDAIKVNRGAVQGKLREARALLTDANGRPAPMTAEVAHNVRMALDDMVDKLKSRTDPSSAGKNAAAGVQQARRRLDEVMKKQVPGMADADEAFSLVARQREALKEGLDLFSGGPKSTMRPDELEAWIKNNPPEVVDALRRGAVNAVDAAMGTARNDPLAVRQMFQKGWNQEKLALLVGPQRAEELVRALDAETTFANSRNRVMSGPQSAARLAGQKEFDNPVARIGDVPTSSASAFGTFVALPVKKGAEFIINGLRGQAKDQQAAYVLDMLSRRGADRDALVRELQRIAQTRSMSATAREAIQRAAQTFARGAVPAGNEYLTQEPPRGR